MHFVRCGAESEECGHRVEIEGSSQPETSVDKVRKNSRRFTRVHDAAGSGSEIFRLEPLPAIDFGARLHESALPAVVKGARLVDPGDVRLDDFPNEEAVFLHHALVMQAALEARVTLVDQRGLHPVGFSCRQPRGGKLVALFRVAVPNGDNLVQKGQRLEY